MNSFQDHSIFNQINPSMLEPKERKPLPFPLENVELDIAQCYSNVEGILTKLRAAKLNPVNNTPSHKKRLSALTYKTKTCLKLLKDISSSCSELWF
jgi:hypothetical protein